MKGVAFADTDYGELEAMKEAMPLQRLDAPHGERERAAGDEAGPFAPPDDLDAFGDFVEMVVRRYKGRIHYYQIWNEPNIYPEWGEQPVDAAEYVELLKVAYTRAKAVDPEVVIIAGALATNREFE